MQLEKRQQNNSLTCASCKWTLWKWILQYKDCWGYKLGQQSGWKHSYHMSYTTLWKCTNCPFTGWEPYSSVSTHWSRAWGLKGGMVGGHRWQEMSVHTFGKHTATGQEGCNAQSCSQGGCWGVAICMEDSFIIFASTPATSLRVICVFKTHFRQ